MTGVQASPTHRSFVPAAGHDLLLPLYDALTRMLGAPVLLERLIRQADLEPGMHVLDIGCGTGTLLRLLAGIEPHVAATGLDPDPKALARARHKLRTARSDITLDLGYSDTLPYGPATFERVFSTFMFHHLDERAKAATLLEILRVLKPRGALMLLDFADHGRRQARLPGRHAHAHPSALASDDDAIAARLRDAGFDEVVELGRQRTLVGHVTWYRARHPGEDAEPC